MSASPTLVYGRPHAGLRGAKIHTFFQMCRGKVQKKIRLLMVSVCDRICMDVGKCRYQLGIGSVFPALRPVQIPSRYRAGTEQIPS